MTDFLGALRQVEEEMLARAKEIQTANNAPDSYYHVAGDEPVDFVLDDEIAAWAARLRGAIEGITVELDSLYPLFMEARARSISIAAMKTHAEREAAWVKLAAHYDAIGAVLAMAKP